MEKVEEVINLEHRESQEKKAFNRRTRGRVEAGLKGIKTRGRETGCNNGA